MGEEMTHWWIYSILDPDTLLPVYIGISMNPLRRFRDHKRTAQAKVINFTYAPIHDWILARLKQGKEPLLKVIASEPTREEAEVLEAILISAFSPILLNVINAWKGGDLYSVVEPAYTPPPKAVSTVIRVGNDRRRKSRFIAAPSEVEPL